MPLINLKDFFSKFEIFDIQQTYKFATTQDASKANHYTNLEEIILHFKLGQEYNDRVFKQLNYCQLKLSSGAIKLLIQT